MSKMINKRTTGLLLLAAFVTGALFVGIPTPSNATISVNNGTHVCFEYCTTEEKMLDISECFSQQAFAYNYVSYLTEKHSSDEDCQTATWNYSGCDNDVRRAKFTDNTVKVFVKNTYAGCKTEVALEAAAAAVNTSVPFDD